MRTVNKDLLRKWLLDNGRHSEAKLAIDADVKVQSLMKVLSGRVPGDDVIYKISKATGIDDEILFPHDEESPQKVSV